MPRPIENTYAPVAVSTTAVASLQTTGGAANLVLANAGPYDFARQISLTSTGNISGVTFTFKGVDSEGYAVTETLAGPNNNTVQTAKYYKTLTSIAAGGAVGTNTSAGYASALLTQCVPLNFYSNFPAQIFVSPSGTISYSLQESNDDVQNASVQPVYFDSFNLSQKTQVDSNLTGSVTLGSTAIRIKVLSYSTGATLRVRIIQPQGTME